MPQPSEYIKQVSDSRLHLNQPVLEDNSIEQNFHTTYVPLNVNQLESAVGDIRLTIQQDNQFYDDHNSFVRIRGQIVDDATGLGINSTKEGGTHETTFAHNGWSYMFNDGRMELQNQEIERYSEFGVNNTLYRNMCATADENEFGLDSCFALDTSYRKSVGVEGANTLKIDEVNSPTINGVPAAVNDGWHKRRQIFTRFTDTAASRGHFSFIIPLSQIFGFARDYKKLITGMSQSLIFTRRNILEGSRIALQCSDTFDPSTGYTPRIKLTEMSWSVPVVKPSLEMEDKLQRMLLDKVEYPLAYRPINTSRLTVPDGAHSFTWNVHSLAVNTETPLFGILAFTRNARTTGTETAVLRNTPSIFEDLDITDASMYANSTRIPQESRDYKMSTYDYMDAYQDLQMFKHKYLGIPVGTRSPIDVHDYKLFNAVHPFDLNYMPKQLRNGVINLKVQAKFGTAIPAGITAHLLLITKKIIHVRSDGNRFNVVQQ